MNYTISDNRLPTFYATVNRFNSLHVSSPCDLASQPITALHYHDNAELGICLNGEGETYIENEIYKFKKGSIQILPPRVSHLSKSKPNVKSTWIWINVNARVAFSTLGLTDPDGVMSLSSNDNFLCGVYNENEYPELSLAVLNLVNDYDIKDENSSLSHALAIANLLLTCKRIKEKQKETPLLSHTIENPSNLEIQSAIEYISSNLDDVNGLNETALAKILNVSVSTLRRKFKEHANMNPKQFIIHSRLAYAEYLLRKTNLTVLEISLRVGYNEISGFNRTFKTFFKLSPSNYRKKFKSR